MKLKSMPYNRFILPEDWLSIRWNADKKFTGLSAQAIGKALAIDPANPRAKLMKLQSEMGSAQFFGKDPKSFCPQAKEMLANWDNFKPKSPIHPVWGKPQVERIVKGCQ